MLVRHAAALAALFAAACAAGDLDPADGADDAFPTGKADGAVDAASPEARAVLALVNDPAVTAEQLDDEARLHRTAAYNIVAHRDGPDGVAGSHDDDPFDDLAELDAVKYVGPVALERLLAYAIDRGYLDDVRGGHVEAIFSPQPYERSHNVRVAELIDAAQDSIDIAMYSYSDARIADALERAARRGVRIRFVFDTAAEDRTKTGAELDASRSAALERAGVDVRWVNKIMHHKFAIVDGPRDLPERAETAWIETGSGNWSYGAATRYDENTLVLRGYPELALRLQREFNLLWDHARDFHYVDYPDDPSRYAIGDEDIGAADDPDTDVWLTSANFSASGDTFRVTGANRVADAYVDAIWAATESIDIASGHLRSRPIAEALIAKHAADPDVAIRVYLDGQEYLSRWSHDQQVRDLEDCLAAAGASESKRRACLDKGFLYSYQVHEAGIPLRYKYYAYRWHYSYAAQMHHKYMIVDGDELYTGSYNYSDNAEHNTFENVLVFRGPKFRTLIDAYRANFDAMWQTGRTDGRLDVLRERVQTASRVPLVFDPMALTWDEVTDLKALIRANCADINTDDYRLHPEQHWSCPR